VPSTSPNIHEDRRAVNTSAAASCESKPSKEEDKGFLDGKRRVEKMRGRTLTIMFPASLSRLELLEGM
jgi:hypothetical protein